MLKSLMRAVALAGLISVCGVGLAQTATQIVQWSASVEPAGSLRVGGKATAAIHAEIKAGWHVYALSQAPGGPTAMTIKLEENPAFAAVGEPTGDAPEKLYDKNFEMDTVLYEHGASFKLPLAVKDSAPAGTAAATVDVHFQTCNERTCLPPATVHLQLEAAILAVVSKAALTTPAVKSAVKASAPVVASAPVPMPAPVEVAKVAVPVAASVVAVPANLTAQGFWSFVWLAMAMGALSLLTPCVFPMIPITVSYFANHAGQTRGASVARAGVYAGGIVATFSAFGMLLAVLFGAGGVNRLAANPWVNLFITAIFLAFALSLFGAFFMQVPARMTQRLDSISRSSGGSLGALLMGVFIQPHFVHLHGSLCRDAAGAGDGRKLALAARGDGGVFERVRDSVLRACAGSADAFDSAARWRLDELGEGRDGFS